MGAGASTLPIAIDKQTAQSYAGAQFDEKAFDAAAKDGIVAKEEFLAAEKAVQRPPTATSKCAALYEAFNRRVSDAIAAQATSTEAAKLAADALWEEQALEPCWVVPMGDDSSFTRHCGLLAALERARAAGKTPLLVDNSEDRVVDTYFSYQQAQILEAKKFVVEERQGMARSAILERARAQLVKALRLGQIVYMRLSNSACDFCHKYSGADTLPLDLFDAKAVAELNENYAAGLGKHFDAADEEARYVGANLWGAESPFAAVLREEDTERGVFVPRRGFEVVVCTHLGMGDFEELLAGRLPMSQLQPIAAVQQVASSDPSAACPPFSGVPQAQSTGSVALAAGAKPPRLAGQLMAPVEACREELRQRTSKEAKEALEAAVRGLLVEVGSHEVAEAECERLDDALVAGALDARNALLKALKSCAACSGFARLPRVAEETRRMLAPTPVKGACGLFEALSADVDACADTRILKAAEVTLDLLAGQGRLRSQLRDAYDGGVDLPAETKEACRAAARRAHKRHEGLRAWKRAQPQKASEGHVCVRFEALNEAVDVADRHDGRGFVLSVETLEAILDLRRKFKGGIRHTLVQEDVGTTCDVRTWMARPQVVGRDGEPITPDAGLLSRLTPDCQYRLSVEGTRREEAPAVAGAKLGGAFANIQLRDEDESAMAALQCSCQVGKPCGRCTATMFGGGG